MKTPNDLQNYLRHFQSLDKLKTELGINYTLHPTLPLVVLKYSQIDSPKYHPIVRQCRGTVLELNTWNIVSQSFLRFYNYGESPNEQDKFDWNNCYINEKVDGSLVNLSFYQNEPVLSTSGSFALGPVENGYAGTWIDLIKEAITNVTGLTFESFCNKLNKKYTYTFELCSPYTKIVQYFPKPIINLIGVIDLAYVNAVSGWYRELNPIELETISNEIGVSVPRTYKFSNFDELYDYIEHNNKEDKTWEGVILRDCNNIRFKVKSSKYVSLHHMKGNNNLFLEKYLLPWVLKNDLDELYTYFPEVKEKADKVKLIVDSEFSNLKSVWEKSYKIINQKEFALSIVKNTKFNSILFTLRKEYGTIQTEEMLKNKWQESGELILKVLFS